MLLYWTAPDVFYYYEVCSYIGPIPVQYKKLRKVQYTTFLGVWFTPHRFKFKYKWRISI